MAQQLTIRAIESMYPHVALPAGLGNLAPATQRAIKDERKRVIARVRKAYAEGRQPTAEELKRY